MDTLLPNSINYWMTSKSKHDCFFKVGLEGEPKEMIGAIKIFLIGHSEVLRRMLDESDMAEKGDILVTDSNPETFRNFLMCIYGGTDIVVRNLAYGKCLNLLYLCEKYLTYEIKEEISSLVLQLNQPLTVDKVLLALSNPACLESESLAKAMSRVIRVNLNKILSHESFLKLDSRGVEFIVEQDCLSIDEIELWKPVLKWAQNKVAFEESKELRMLLENVLKHIRFCTMSCAEICIFVIPSKVLTLEEIVEICNCVGTKKTPNLDKLSQSVVKRDE